MSDETVPACIDFLRVDGADRFRAARQFDLRDRDPCRYCFGDGEIDEAIDNLLVSRRSKDVVHRLKGTGNPYPHGGSGDIGTSLAHKLANTDPDEVGGGA